MAGGHIPVNSFLIHPLVLIITQLNSNAYLSLSMNKHKAQIEVMKESGSSRQERAYTRLMDFKA